jgi:pentatricopeptide repeat protein
MLPLRSVFCESCVLCAARTSTDRYVTLSRPSELQATLDQMRERGLQVSNISFTTVMKSLVNQNRVDDATQLLADMHSLKVCIYT